MRDTVYDQLAPEESSIESPHLTKPAAPNAVSGKRRLFKPELVLIYCLAMVVTVGLQWRNGAFETEFTSISDESAHYVTGLMLRDYIAQGLPERPMAYARNYYEHYPRVALGHWPPVFYVLQALWTIPFGVSRMSLIMLMAAISAGLLTTTYVLSARYFPRWLSLALMIFLAGLPAMQALSSGVMSEVLVSLLVLWSVLMLERYFATPGWFTATGFALVAAAAILTKGTGLVLSLVPAPAAVLSRRRLHFRSASFWISASLVVIVCAPWFLLVPGALHERVAKFGGIVFLPGRLWSSLIYLSKELSFGGFALACAGMVTVFFKNQDTPIGNRDESRMGSNVFWMLGILLVLSTMALRVVISVWEERHLLTLLPFFTLLIGAGIWWIVDLTFRRDRAGVILALCALAGIFVVNVARGAPKRHIGLDRVAQDLVHDSRFQNSRLLIASDSTGEGVFVAEVAMHEGRPGHFVERGSKLLAADGFLGDHYELKFRTPADLMNFLETEPARVVVLDAPVDPPEHLEMVRQTIAQYPDRWRLVSLYPRIGKDQSQTLGIQVYALAR